MNQIFVQSDIIKISYDKMKSYLESRGYIPFERHDVSVFDSAFSFYHNGKEICRIFYKLGKKIASYTTFEPDAELITGIPQELLTCFDNPEAECKQSRKQIRYTYTSFEKVERSVALICDYMETGKIGSFSAVCTETVSSTQSSVVPEFNQSLMLSMRKTGRRFVEYIGRTNDLTGYANSYRLVFIRTILEKCTDGIVSVSDVMKFFYGYYLANPLAKSDRNNDIESDCKACSYEYVCWFVKNHVYRPIHDAGFLFVKNEPEEFYAIPSNLKADLTANVLLELIKILDFKIDFYRTQISCLPEYPFKELQLSKEMNDLCKGEEVIISRADRISVLKKTYYILAEKDQYQFKSNAFKRSMSADEYALFLFGYPTSFPSIYTDDKVDVFFEIHKRDDGKVYLSPNDDAGFYLFAKRNGTTVKEIAELWGYDFQEVKTTVLSRKEKTETQTVRPVEYKVTAEELRAFRKYKESKISEFAEAKKILKKSGRYVDVGEINQFSWILARLETKAEKGIRRNKYLSDIRFDDSEYEIIKQYLQYAVMIVKEQHRIIGPSLFVAGVVDVARRVYEDGGLWRRFFAEINLPNQPILQGVVGEAFTQILKERNKYIVEGNNNYQNILLHCFVADHYLNEYFQFLYDFYRIDLDRDIERLKSENGGKELMDGLMASIFAEEGGRTYHLRQHTSQSMAANPNGARIRVRNHLKKLDMFYWDYTYHVNSSHRIYNAMQEWAGSNHDFVAVYKNRGINVEKGPRRFSSPYIKYDGMNSSLILTLPSQSVSKERNDDLRWVIDCDTTYEIVPEMKESVVGYQVLESSISIPMKSALSEYQINLKNAFDETIKHFCIKAEDIRFFDRNGLPVSSLNLKIGDVISVSSEPVKSSALYESEGSNGMVISYFQFAFEDIVLLPNGKAVIVGKEKIENGLIGKGLVEKAICSMDGSEYALYSIPPYLAIRMNPRKESGTLIGINTERYSLSSINAVKFKIDDRSGDEGFYIDLAQFIESKSGIYQIAIDIPGVTNRAWNFVYIDNFFASYEESPYVFEPRATISLPNELNIDGVDKSCEKDKNANVYRFEIENVGRYFSFSTIIENNSVDISIPVPALFWNIDGTWSSLRPQAIWHTELPDVIDISVPYHKLSLSIDENDDTVRALEFSRKAQEDFIHCDIVKFKSYLKDSDWKSIRMKFSNVEEFELFSIIIHSRVLSVQVFSDCETDQIIVQSNIIGKAKYYADLSKDGKEIAEKVPFVNGSATVNYQIENGIYDVILYEAEEDDSGFGELYYKLGSYKQRLVNPLDMTGRSLQVLQIEKLNESVDSNPLGFEYFVDKLKSTDSRNVYTGTMYVQKTKYFPLAAFPVSVKFKDILHPELVWISFIDDGYNVEFLYDTKRKAIVQEENPDLNKKASYVRYTVLDEFEDVFRIEFCDRDPVDYADLPNKLVLFERQAEQSFFEQRRNKRAQFEKYIDDITWSREALFALRCLGYSTLRQLSELTRDEFIRYTHCEELVVNQIERVMRNYSYQFKVLKG